MREKLKNRREPRYYRLIRSNFISVWIYSLKNRDLKWRECRHKKITNISIIVNIPSTLFISFQIIAILAEISYEKHKRARLGRVKIEVKYLLPLGMCKRRNKKYECIEHIEILIETFFESAERREWRVWFFVVVYFEGSECEERRYTFFNALLENLT